METTRLSSDRATETMRAVTQTAYGPPETSLERTRLPVPTVAADQVLVAVAASSLNALEWHYLTGTPYFLRFENGFRAPKRLVPGADVAGTVVAVGNEVSSFQIGDEVFGEIGSGGFAEYAVAPAQALAHRSRALPLEEHATLGVAALTALQGLRDWGALQPGDRVLVNGASGGVGTFAVQIAKALGASHVTAVCSPRNVDTAHTLGADRVLDYTSEDLAGIDDRFDVFFDNAGSLSISQSRRLLTGDGTLVMITGNKGRWFRPADRMVAGMIRSKFWSQGFASRVARASGQDGAVLAEMVTEGRVRPVIDRRFTLDDAVDALVYQGEGHARGKSLVLP
ncbi:MAG TPA: NAD(P)-dependent alcohol dehydrogenase [Acidimicrobiia bacterium]